MQITIEFCCHMINQRSNAKNKNIKLGNLFYKLQIMDKNPTVTVNSS